MSEPIFRDRTDAGRHLARALRSYADTPGLLVLGLPRGGVPVAYEVATALQAPLDIFMVRKLGVPGQEELAMGAIASGDVIVWNQDVLDAIHLRPDVLTSAVERERRELVRREAAYRGDRAHPSLADRTVILIDDGFATGASMRAAAAAVRSQQPAVLVVAVPVAAHETCQLIAREVDDVVCVATPEPFLAVGIWYADFSPTTDEEVRELLRRAAERAKEEAAR